MYRIFPLDSLRDQTKETGRYIPNLHHLQTDYVDLYVIHRFDYGTTMEEIIEALELVLDAETVKYLEEPYRVKPVAAHE